MKEKPSTGFPSRKVGLRRCVTALCAVWLLGASACVSSNTRAIDELNRRIAALGLDLRLVAVVPRGQSVAYRGMTLTSFAFSATEIDQHDFNLLVGTEHGLLFESGWASLWNYRAADLAAGREFSALQGPFGDAYPVFGVNWYDGALFCNRLSERLGLEPVYTEGSWTYDFNRNGFHLPTEAQWEFAAGGPEHTEWPLGDAFVATDYDFAAAAPLPVASLRPNGFGLYDIGGNVLELIQDKLSGDYLPRNGTRGERGGVLPGYYPYTGQTDPYGESVAYHAIVRGGSYMDVDPDHLRCEYSSFNSGSPVSAPNFGFRVAVNF